MITHFVSVTSVIFVYREKHDCLCCCRIESKEISLVSDLESTLVHKVIPMKQDLPDRLTFQWAKLLIIFPGLVNFPFLMKRISYMKQFVGNNH